MSSLEEIKNKIDVVEFIGEYVELRKAGANFKGLCPFHDEKSPSFMVSREKQIWHCFGCGKGGDIFKFLMEKEGADFGEALRILAKRAGITLTNEDRRVSGERTKLLAILDAAAKFYHHELLHSEEASSARIYLQKRGLTAETVVRFLLGYAPASFDALLTHLQTKYQYKTEDIVAAGLAMKKEKRATSAMTGREFYDRFRGRIMFPIHDAWGHVTGFTGRILPQDEEKKDIGGKYVNSPTTALYNKSAILYGLAFAKEGIRKHGCAVVVEGNMDVISSHQAGIAHVVAASGTALTGEQIRLIKRFTNTIILAFDADFAGEGAAMRGIEQALREEMNIKVVVMPEIKAGTRAKDPDELVRQSPDLWQEAIWNALPLPEFVFWKMSYGKNLEQITERKNVAEAMVRVIAKLPSAIERSFWIKEMANRLGLKEDVLEGAVQQSMHQITHASIYTESTQTHNRRQKLEERILAIAVKTQPLCAIVKRELTYEHFSQKDLQCIYETIPLCYTEDQTIHESKIKELIMARGADPHLFDILLLIGDGEFGGSAHEECERELTKSIKELKDLHVREERERLTSKLREAERINDTSAILELMNQLNRLMHYS